MWPRQSHRKPDIAAGKDLPFNKLFDRSFGSEDRVMTVGRMISLKLTAPFPPGLVKAFQVLFVPVGPPRNEAPDLCFLEQANRKTVSPARSKTVA